MTALNLAQASELLLNITHTTWLCSAGRPTMHMTALGATGGGMDPREMVNLKINLVIKCAEEIYALGGA
jgi:hypothetical protein